jgi:hypothetical protein
MPQGFDYFGDTKDALRMMIPLVINRRNIEANALEQEKRIAALKEQSQAELLREVEKQKAEERRAKDKVNTDFLLKQLESAQQAGAQEPYQAIASQLAQKGLQLPSYFSAPEGVNRYQMLPPKPDKEKGPTTEWGALYKMAGGDQNRLAEIVGALEERKQAAAARHRSPRENAIKHLEELVVQKIQKGEDPSPVVELLKQVNEAKRAPGESQESKVLKDMENEILSLSKHLNNLQAGVNITSDLTPEGRNAAIKSAQQQLSVMERKYRAMGGDPARIGRADEQPQPGVVPDWRQFK